MPKYARSFELRGPWDERMAAATRSYLESRRFTVAESGGVITGSRGSWFGNLTGYDMRRLIATIEVDPSSSPTIQVKMSVNGALQMITEWNDAFFRLELIELQAVLQSGAGLPNWWAPLLKESDESAIAWTFTMMIAGRKMTPEWRRSFKELEAVPQFGIAAGMR